MFGIHHFLPLETAALGAGVPFQRRSCPCSGIGRGESEVKRPPDQLAYIPDIDAFHPSRWLNVCQSPSELLRLLPGVLQWRANPVQCGGAGKGTRWKWPVLSPTPQPQPLLLADVKKGAAFPARPTVKFKAFPGKMIDSLVYKVDLGLYPGNLVLLKLPADGGI